jgi:hypothetical protein
MALISSGTGGDKIAAGTTNQRPAVTAADAGTIRFNKTEGSMERWDGTSWGPMGGASVHVGNSPPNNKAVGDLWYNTNDGMLYVYYTDANSSQWVDASPSNVDGRDYVETSGGTMTGDLTVPGLNGGPLAGFRNIIINGDVTINQRGKAYSAATNNTYWADRWQKKNGGKMVQIIEAGNFIPTATYTLSGTNVTTQQLTAPGAGDWAIPTVPSNARKIQLELGTVATQFEQRPLGVEIALCQRYYHNMNVFWEMDQLNYQFGLQLYFPVMMHHAPNIMLTGKKMWDNALTGALNSDVFLSNNLNVAGKRYTITRISAYIVFPCNSPFDWSRAEFKEAFWFEAEL